mmetsp:Transcript_26169/g.55403  ORF Transcript_26169/g.55403 Transcript_26169/m.55403 type:complete len:526 (-) Transcript_26169:90-1667(-)
MRFDEPLPYSGDGVAPPRGGPQAIVSRLSHKGGIYASRWELAAPYLAELIGTFLITLTFTCNYGDSHDPVWSITSNAFMWMALVCSVGHISGANLNPSITIGLVIAGRLKAKTATLFCVCQIAGAVGAVFLNHEVSSARTDLNPHRGYTWVEVGVVEVMYSAMTCFVYLNCAASVVNNSSKRQNGFIGLAVGFCVITGGYAAWEVSRAVLNTAISIAIAIVDASMGQGFKCGVYYFIFDFAGAFIGVGAFAAVRPNEFRRSDVQTGPTKVDSLSAKVLAEFLGTLYIILTQALSRLSPLRDSLPGEWAVAAAVTCMSYSVRGISGGHFNPAVTVSVWSSRRDSCDLKTACSYIVVQIIAGLAASAVFDCVKPPKVYLSTDSIEIKHAFSVQRAMIVEGFYTAMVCYTVLATGVVKPVPLSEKQPNNLAGFLYGSMQAAAGFASHSISGSNLNPAAVIGFDILGVHRRGEEDAPWGCILYELVGALVAAAVFFVTHARLYREAAAEAASVEDCTGSRGSLDAAQAA